MDAEALMLWPPFLANMTNQGTWNETAHSTLTMNAAGEELAIPVYFDGSYISGISVALDAGTAADNLEMQLQLCTRAHDTVNVSSFPSGVPITNGTSTSLSSKGGSTEVIEFIFPSSVAPTGMHWCVIVPSSAGAFSIECRYASDWWPGQTHRLFHLSKSYLYDGLDWNNPATVGNPAGFRVKNIDGTYQYSSMMHPPLTSVEHTFNVTDYKHNKETAGVKFKAPYDMTGFGVKIGIGFCDLYSEREFVAIDSSNNVISRTHSYPHYYHGTITAFCPFNGLVQFNSGETYRIYVRNPIDDANRMSLLKCTLDAPSSFDYLRLTSGEYCYTYADDPVSEGGAGSWTDNENIIPFFTIYGLQDPNNLAGTGGGGAPAPDPEPRARLGVS